jgi:hypothetical protein
MKKKIFICIAGLLSILTASAQLKVSSDSTVCIGVYQDAASTLSVGGTGSGDYEAYVNGAGKAADDIFGTTYHPTAFPGYSTGSIQAALSQLLQLVPVAYQYNTIPPIDATGPEGTDEEGQQGRPSFTGRRFCISSQSLSTFFGELMHKDENNQWQADYDELVPALVYAVQQLYALAAQNHNIVVNQQGEITVQTEGQDGADEASSGDRMAAAPYRCPGAQLFRHTFDPLTARTDIHFRLPEDTQDAYICISDLMGKRIGEIPVSAGQESVTIQGYELSSGMYLYSLVINGQEIDTKRMILSK